MSKTADARTAISPRAWIGLVVADVVLFLLANVTAKSSSHPGAVSNIFFGAFVIGTVSLIVCAAIAVAQSRRRAAR